MKHVPMSEGRLKIKPLSKNLLFRSKGGPKEKTAYRATLTQAILRVQTGPLRYRKPFQQQMLYQHQALPRIWPSPYPTYDSGIGGSTDPIRKAGLIIIAIVKGRKKIAHAYILDQEVAGNKAICLIGLRTLVDETAADYGGQNLPIRA